MVKIKEHEAWPGTKRSFFIAVTSLLLLASCPGVEHTSEELIDVLQGSPKKENVWGSLSAKNPNNIGNTFTADSKTTRTITWQSGMDTGEVIIGNNRYTSTSVLQNEMYFHRVDITGLAPGKTYRFIAGTTDRYSPIYSFKTENSSYSDGFSVIHITDPQIRKSNSNAENDAKIWKQVIEAAVKTSPDAAFFVNTGDVVDKINEDRIPYYFDYAQEILAGYAFIYSLGNNDSLDWYNKYFYMYENASVDSSGILYSFDYGNTHFVSINYQFSDSNDEDDVSITLSDQQMDWLKNDLKNTSRTWKVAMTHKSDFGRKKGSNSESEITKLFNKYNVNLVMAGHYHFYMRTNPINSKGNNKLNGTVWTIPNAAGSKFNNREEPGDGKEYLAVTEQPELPMFTEFVFTETNIYLKAYTVDTDGKEVLFDEYTFY